MYQTEILGFFPPAQPENRKHSTKKIGTRCTVRVQVHFATIPSVRTPKMFHVGISNFWLIEKWSKEITLHSTSHRTFQYFELISKLDVLLGHLKYAAKVNVAFGFVMKILRTHAVDLFILREKIHCWRKTNCCLQGTT